jgi:hypothetical protein
MTGDLGNSLWLALTYLFLHCIPGVGLKGFSRARRTHPLPHRYGNVAQRGEGTCLGSHSITTY